MVKDKLGLLFNIRRSYADLFLKMTDYRDNSLYFFDTNLKLDYKFNDRNRLFLSFFASHDKTALSETADMQWTNMAGSLSWLHQFRGQSTSQTLLRSEHCLSRTYPPCWSAPELPLGVRQA